MKINSKIVLYLSSDHRKRESEPDFNDNKSFFFQETRQQIYISKRQNIWLLLTIDNTKWCVHIYLSIYPSTFLFTVTKYMTNIPKSFSIFSLFLCKLGPKIRYGAHTHISHIFHNAFHGRSSFIDPLSYGLGEWVDEHILCMCVCYVCDIHLFHFH